MDRIGIAQGAAQRRSNGMNPARVFGLRQNWNPDAGHLFLHVFYDTPVMQSASAIVCDQLRASFHADLEVHTLWSHFQHLADPHYSREAAEVAAQSDVVIVATASHDALPGTVARWLGSWICQHQKEDAMFCGLFLQRPDQELRLPPIARLLEATARLTRREWLSGCVRRQPDSIPVAPCLPPASGTNISYFHTPVCHGING